MKKEQIRTEKTISREQFTGPKKIYVRQQQSERQHAQNGAPDYVFTPNVIADGSANDGANSNRS